jgi:branched-chain amino acid transport system permease protein
MDFKEIAEDFWDEIKKKAYYIVFVLVVIIIPFLYEVPGYKAIPVLSKIYDIINQLGVFGSRNYFIQILSLCIIWAIFAASWDFLSGYTGQINFGHAVFFGVSAYTAYWVSSGFVSFTGSYIKLDPINAFIIGAIISALFACILGVIALRVKGPYLALITLVIPLITSSVFKLELFYNLTGGDHGLINTPQIMQHVIHADPKIGLAIDLTNFYVFALIVLFISIGIMMLLAKSRLGLAFQSIREDEDAAESLGINVQFYKIFAFSVSAFFAGVAGGLYGQYSNVVQPAMFDTEFSFTIIIMVVIGGIGSIGGGVIGAFLLTILTELFLRDIFPTSAIEGVNILAFGLLLVISLRYMPYGLTRATNDQKKAVVAGLMLALFWVMLPIIDPLSYLMTFSLENILVSIILIGILIFTLPAVPVFFISNFIGITFLSDILGLSMNSNVLIKANFLICAIIGIPYAYYLPKIFKKIRLRFWGTWPSAGRYEPPE